MTAAPVRAAAPVVEGPPDPYLVRIRDLIYEVAGIFHPDNKLRLLSERCERRMKEVRSCGLHDYLDFLTNEPARQSEMTALLNEITIGETCFFRNRLQLDALCKIILPKILKIKARTLPRKLRIWSAGCSTGEEPYTLSMILQEETPELLAGWGIEIHASDINEKSLEHAKRGMYSEYSARNVSPRFRQKYFMAAEEQVRVLPALRSNITFRRLNLFDDSRMNGMTNFDLIFCCNVLIYFDLASKRRVIGHFRDSLLPHGYLFLGPSESLYKVSDDFHLIHLPGATAYAKNECPPAGK